MKQSIRKIRQTCRRQENQKGKNEEEDKKDSGYWKETKEMNGDISERKFIDFMVFGSSFPIKM